MIRTLGFLIVSLGIGAETLPAQAVDTVAIPDPSRAAIVRLRPRIESADVVAVRTPSGRSVLWSPRVTSGGIAYVAVSGKRAEQIGNGPFLIERHVRQTWTGALAGAIVGLGAGALIGLRVAGIGCIDYEGAEPCRVPYLEVAVAAGVIGAGMGGFAGAVIGTLFKAWRPIYRSPGWRY